MHTFLTIEELIVLVVNCFATAFSFAVTLMFNLTSLPTLSIKDHAMYYPLDFLMLEI